MTTLNNLLQRIQDEYLEPVNEETPATTLVGDITDVATSFIFTDGVFSPDELSWIAPGRLLELDTELVRVTDFDQVTQTVTCKRGVRGTTAAAHLAATADVRIPTRWPREVVLRALRSSIDGLWQPLFAIKTEQTILEAAEYLSLPLDTVRIISVEYEQRDGDWQYMDAKLLPRNPLDPTVAAIQLPSSPYSGKLALITYGVQIVAPVLNTDTIVDLPEKYERIVLTDAASELLAGIDIDASTQERLTEQIKLEGFPVRSGASVSQSLIGYHEYLVDRANKELVAQWPRRITRQRINIWG